VENVTQTSTTDEAYGAGGALLARYTGDSNSRSFVPFGGGILAEYYCGGMIFDHPDEIGSATTATDCTGNNVQERLYYPFGEFWTGANPDNLGMHQMFAKLPDYDPETDQYNTANRHYTPSGRWLTPDPGGLKVVRLDDPQTWNMYAYARNKPTTVTDPSGLLPPQQAGHGDPNVIWWVNGKRMGQNPVTLGRSEEQAAPGGPTAERSSSEYRCESDGTTESERYASPISWRQQCSPIADNTALRVWYWADIRRHRRARKRGSDQGTQLRRVSGFEERNAARSERCGIRSQSNYGHDPICCEWEGL
jgi:RHS repeat-associated protein